MFTEEAIVPSVVPRVSWDLELELMGIIRSVCSHYTSILNLMLMQAAAIGPPRAMLGHFQNGMKFPGVSD